MSDKQLRQTIAKYFNKYSIMEEKDKKKNENQKLEEKDLEQAAGGIDKEELARMFLTGRKPLHQIPKDLKY